MTDERFARCERCGTFHEPELLAAACPVCHLRAQEDAHRGDLWRLEGLGLVARVTRAGTLSSLEDALERLNFLERQLEFEEEFRAARAAKARPAGRA